FAFTVDAKAIKQSGGRVLRQTEYQAIRRKVEQKPAVVAGHGTQVAKGLDSLGSTRLVTQALRGESNAVLVTGGMHFRAVGNRIGTLLFCGRGCSRGSGVKGNVSGPRGERNRAGDFQDGPTNIRRTLTGPPFGFFLCGLSGHEAQQVIVDKGL